MRRPERFRPDSFSRFLKNNPRGQALVAKLEHRHGKGKALSILAHKLARAVYAMLRRQEAFDVNRFFMR